LRIVLAKRLAITASLLALCAGPAHASAAPITISANAPAGAFFSASADGSEVAYESGNKRERPIYLWKSGQTREIAPAAEGSPLNFSLSADGGTVAISTVKHGQWGTIFYGTATRQRSFVPGFILNFYGGTNYAPKLSANGRYVVGSTFAGKTPFRQVSGVVYDRARMQLIHLPVAAGNRAEPQAISANGRVVLYAESRPYKGQVAADMYEWETRKRRRIKGALKWISWLSSDGATAILQRFEGESRPWIYHFNGSPDFFKAPEIKHEGWQPEPFAPNSDFTTAFSLSGDGQRLAFTCLQSIFYYDLPSGTFFEAASDFLGATEKRNSYGEPVGAELNAVITELGNAFVVNEGSPRNSSEHATRGLYEIPVASPQSYGAAVPPKCLPPPGREN
jgi:hypothetical protein